MNIYVDFDDCLCETGRAFADLAAGMFGKDIPYEEMEHFNLQKSFSLTDDEYDRLLVRGHEPEVLLSFEETPGASRVIREWMAGGHNVSIITGRPFSASPTVRGRSSRPRRSAPSASSTGTSTRC